MLRYFSESEEVDIRKTWGLPLPLKCLRLILCGGGRQVALAVETFLEVTAAWGWGDEVNRNRVLSGDCNRLPR